MKTFYISTAIPYVNGAPHIGHALEFVQADVVARYRRQQGDNVFFLTGTDDNALKNVQAAVAAGVSVDSWVNQHADVFKVLVKKLDISNTDFIRTSIDTRHLRGAQKLWQSCQDEDIYKKKYKGLYCLGCEEFKSANELINGECSEHPGKKVEVIEEENYFFRLSKYQKQLDELISTDALKIVPETRKNEALSFIRGGLEDFSISRSRERAQSWGIEVPNDSSQMMYVWFDALSNYINALGYADEAELFHHFWKTSHERIHIIGKGINRFHTIYWPAMLLSAKVRLPSKIFIHGYLTINNQKISKTLGNVIDPFEVIDRFGVDATRYYLLREIPAYDDGDFSYEKLSERYDSDLANGLGNFAARVSTLGEKIGTFSMAESLISDEIKNIIAQTQKSVSVHLDLFLFHEALLSIWSLISFGDKYVNEKQPWKTQDHAVITNLLFILYSVSELLIPFLPATAEKIKNVFQEEGDLYSIKKLILFPRR